MGLLLLVRHGQASFGAAHYDKLSDLGYEQARLLGARLAASDLSIDRVVSGSLQRQLETVQGIGETLDLSSVPTTVQADLNEYNFDDVLGSARREVTFDPASAEGRAHANTAMDFATERWVRGEGSYLETHAGFTDRVGRALSELAAGPGTTLAVSSGGVIGAVVAHLLGLDAVTWISVNRVMANSAVTKIVLGRSGRTLVTMNDHAHLEHDRSLITYR